MRTKKFALVALLAVALIVMGTTVSPRVVYATDLDFEMSIGWAAGLQHYNVGATLTLLNDAGQPVASGYVNLPMSCDPEFQFWTITIQDVPTTAVTARFEWDPGVDLEWQGNGYIGIREGLARADWPVNWQGLTMIEIGVAEM
jgi:hypothetical protein